MSLSLGGACLTPESTARSVARAFMQGCSRFSNYMTIAFVLCHCVYSYHPPLILLHSGEPPRARRKETGKCRFYKVGDYGEQVLNTPCQDYCMPAPPTCSAIEGWAAVCRENTTVSWTIGEEPLWIRIARYRPRTGPWRLVWSDAACKRTP